MNEWKEDSKLEIPPELVSQFEQAVNEKEQREIMKGIISQDFSKLLKSLRVTKPEDRSEEARRFAVTITELEKVAAYYEVYINR